MPASNVAVYGPTNRICTYLSVPFVRSLKWLCKCSSSEQDIYITTPRIAYYNNGNRDIDVGTTTDWFCAGCGSLHYNRLLYVYIKSHAPKIAAPTTMPFLAPVVDKCIMTGRTCQVCYSAVYYANHSELVIGPDGKDIFQQKSVCHLNGHILAGMVYEGVGRLYGQGVVKTQATPQKCGCGMASCGAPPRSPVHARYCAEYDDTPPPQKAETQEQLAARIRAAKKGFGLVKS